VTPVKDTCSVAETPKVFAQELGWYDWLQRDVLWSHKMMFETMIKISDGLR
jgi:hypothetical protein